MTEHAPMTLAECHRAHGFSMLDGVGCRCFQPGTFLECPAEARRPLEVRLLAKPAALPKPKAPERLSGDFCPDCGSTNLVRAGTCLLCKDCGSTTGGCS